MEKYEKRAMKLTDKSTRKAKKSTHKNSYKKAPSKAQNGAISHAIDENHAFLVSVLGNGIGLTFTKYDILEKKAQVGIAYIQSIVDKNLISSHIVKPLIESKIDTVLDQQHISMLIQSKFIQIPDIKKTCEMKQLMDYLLTGYTIVFLQRSNEAFAIGSRKFENRAVEAPNNEATVLASQDSFTEDVQTNCSMIIRRLPTPDLHFEEFIVGSLSRTKIKLLWLKNKSNLKVVNEVRKRIENINVESMDGIGSLAELIVEKPLSVFPKYRQTQRPDLVAKRLSEGYTAILCNNSPFALIAPMFFWDNFKTMDDYSENTFVVSFLRLVRIFSFILSTSILALYVSFVTYNQAIVPAPLAINIATGRDGVPFPSIVEVLILSVAITIIREASLRLPGSVGYFIGALAAVVIGQAAVTAGYVSASVIIVVAVSAISSFAISSTTIVYPSRLINYLLILFAGTFGMFGLINGLTLVTWHLVSLHSFGMPYMYPLVPFDMQAMKDTFIRAPFKNNKKQPGMLLGDNSISNNNKGFKNQNGNR